MARTKHAARINYGIYEEDVRFEEDEYKDEDEDEDEDEDVTPPPESSDSSTSIDPGLERRERRHRGGAFTPQHFPMTRDQVLEMSTADFEALVERRARLVARSADVKAEVAKIRRLIKNREASMRSRAERKKRLDDLQRRCAKLERENAALTNENRLLKIQAYFAEGGVLLATPEPVRLID